MFTRLPLERFQKKCKFNFTLHRDVIVGAIEEIILSKRKGIQVLLTIGERSKILLAQKDLQVCMEVSSTLLSLTPFITQTSINFNSINKHQEPSFMVKSSTLSKALSSKKQEYKDLMPVEVSVMLMRKIP